MWDSLFAIASSWALMGWAALILLPRRPVVLSAILYGGVALLCLTYLAAFVAMQAGWIGMGGVPRGEPGLTSVEGLMAAFSTRGWIVVGWVHYLALDLFAGLWIARDADNKGLSRLVQAPVLLITLLLAPIGLLLWLIMRERRARIQAKTRPFA